MSYPDPAETRRWPGSVVAVVRSSSSQSVAASLRQELDRYPVGGKLPSSRALVERFGVSPVTVTQALALLVAEGLVVTRPGAGAFRAGPAGGTGPIDTSWQQVALNTAARLVDASGLVASLAAPVPGVIAFNGGYLHPSLQPDQALGAALARAGRRPDAWERPPLEGLPALRSWFARDVGAPGIAAAQVLVAGGGQAALTTAVQAIVPP